MKTRMMMYPILFLMVSLSLVADPQKDERSGKGVVILNNETVLFGNVTYHLDYDLVTIEKDERTFTYNTNQVQLFQYYHREKGMNRIFTSVEIHEPRGRKYKKAFLEVVKGGSIPIYRKEKNVMVEEVTPDSRGSILKHMQGSIPELRVAYDFYYHKDGQAQLIRDFEQQLLPIMDDCPMLHEYIRKNRLRLDNWSDQFRLLSYYEEIKNQGKPSAKQIIQKPVLPLQSNGREAGNASLN